MIRLRAAVRNTVERLLRVTRLCYWPVRVRSGIAKGARWTVFPYSAYWRGKTEMDVEAAIQLNGTVSGGCCWDLGAHFGIYAVGMALAVGETGEVIALEPDPVSFLRCQRHVRMNRLGWVKLFNAAASDRSGADELLLALGAGETTSHLKYAGETAPAESRKVIVQLLTLDSLVDSHQIRLPDFIKIDVEGHGAKALAGARRSIEKKHPTLVMSFHSQDELDGAKAVLEPLGYRPSEPSGGTLNWLECLHRTATFRADVG